MDTISCEQLDEYLAESLSDPGRAGFESHLATCDDCRREVERQQRIDRLLAEGAERFDAVPPSLIDTVEAYIQSRTRRRTVRLVWGLSAAAAAIVVLIGIWSVRERGGQIVEQQPVAAHQDSPAAVDQDVASDAGIASDVAHAVRVVPSDPAAAILVPMKTTARNVSIVWVYPTVAPADIDVGSEAN